ncbi:hypothetical protein [Haloferula sp.]|uniref:hypothetical protein n=1 Tax=Haloferula sp. TaxID=2497595 RepID=UPI003C74861F
MKNLLTTSLILFATSLSSLGIPLTVLPWDDEISERELSVAYGTKIIDIGYLHPSARSKPLNIPSEALNLRLEVNDRKDAEGKPLALKINLPSNVKTPLLLLLPDEKSKAGLRTLVIEDDVSSFRWGTFRLINITPKPLVFRWDKQAKAVPPGWKPVTVDPEGKSRNIEVFLYLKDDLKKPLYTAVWEHRSDMRQLVFMVPSSNAALGPVEFKTIPEIRIEEEAEAP